MIKVDPIIAVENVNKSSEWYLAVLGCKRTHGGNDFTVLVDKNEEVIVCLHKWGEHDHPTLINPNISPGNGLILYYKTDDLDKIWQNIKAMEWPVEQEIHINRNSRKKEFSLRDIDGYYWTITEFHNYEG